MCLHGLSPAQSVRDANSIWNFREALTRAKIDGKPSEDGAKRVDLAIPAFGYKNLISASTAPTT